VYYPTRKGKGVFEKKFSETLFCFYIKGKGAFCGAGISAVKAILAFLFSDLEGVGL
jgi:hypothetical protein